MQVHALACVHVYGQMSTLVVFHGHCLTFGNRVSLALFDYK